MQQNHILRIMIIGVLIIASFLTYTFVLGNIQLVHGEEYLTMGSVYTVENTEPAYRGEITDAFGRPLAVNAVSYALVFNALDLPKARLNEIISTLVNEMSKTGDTWIDTMPITSEEPYDFIVKEQMVRDQEGNIDTQKSKEATDKERGRVIAAVQKRAGVSSYADAATCLSAIIDQYKLQDYHKTFARQVAGVRYSMETYGYNLSKPYPFATGVQRDTGLHIQANSHLFPGVELRTEYTRDYVSGMLAPQLVGHTGKIPEYTEALKNDGYAMDAVIGLSGIEQKLEEHLRGKAGKKEIQFEEDGRREVVISESQPGDTVMLTLDKRLQAATQESIEKNINHYNATRPYVHKSSGRTLYATAGSAVVINVNNGEILAAANYPSYAMNDYLKDPAPYLEASPPVLANRAFSGRYRPGSTFKPGVAAIGLELGKITPGGTIFCAGEYEFYGFRPTCLGHHGSKDVVGALCVSCNIFFYETGKRIGMDSMEEYWRTFGLGVKTGAQVAEQDQNGDPRTDQDGNPVFTGAEFDETAGLLESRIHREPNQPPWQEGNMIQAAIGQADTVCSPLQLATYVSTIANKGTRYETHLVKRVVNTTTGELVWEAKPTVASTTGISEANYNVVIKGMQAVTQPGGTAAAIFGSYPIKIACKTGTAEIGRDAMNNNSLFVAYAPVDKPEIAVAVVVESTAGGWYSQSIAEDIFNAYFFASGDEYAFTQTGVLLD